MGITFEGYPEITREEVMTLRSIRRWSSARNRSSTSCQSLQISSSRHIV